MKVPTIVTKRFILRPHTKFDAQTLARNINDRMIARNTMRIVYPYRLKNAKEWIAKLTKDARKKQPTWRHFAIDIGGEVVGGIGFDGIEPAHKAELGYWLARKYWGRGIMTEAVRAVVRYGFTTLRFKRISAYTLTFNTSSQRVLKKNGFKQEGYLRENVKKNGRFVDSYLYAKTR